MSIDNQEYVGGGIKPTAVNEGKTERILEKIKESGLEIVEQTSRPLTTEEALEFYPEENKLKDDLIKHSTSGLWEFFIARGEKATTRLRKILGTTRLADRPPRGIRGEFGTSRIRNAVHATKTVEELETLAKVVFPDSNITIKPIDYDENNLPPAVGSHGYHGEMMIDKNSGVIIKTIRHTNTKFPDELYREYLILGFIADLGISPRPIEYCTQTSQSDELTMEYMNGTLWNNLSSSEQDRLLPNIGTTLGLLHNETRQHGYYEARAKRISGNLTECMMTNIDVIQSFARECGYQSGLDFIEKFRPFFQRRAEQHAHTDPSFSLIHFDVSPGNVVFQNKKIRLIDWGMAHYNDPALDIARAVIKITDGSDEAIRNLVSKYPQHQIIPRVYEYLPLAYLATAIGRYKYRNEHIPDLASLRSQTHEQILNIAVYRTRLLKSGRYD